MRKVLYEELRKISVLNDYALNSGNITFVYDNIIWIEEKFYKLINLHSKNEERFFELFPNSHEFIIAKQPEKFDWDLIFEAPIANKKVHENKDEIFNKKLINTKQYSDNEAKKLSPYHNSDFFLFNSIESIWKLSVELNKPELTLLCCKIFENWIYFLLRIKHARFNFLPMVKNYLLNLFYMKTTLDIRGYTTNSQIIDELNHGIYIPIIFNYEVDLESAVSILDQIYINHKSTISYGNSQSFSKFVKRIINSSYYQYYDNNYQIVLEKISRSSKVSYVNKLYELISNCNSAINDEGFKKGLTDISEFLSKTEFDIPYKNIEGFIQHLINNYKYLKLKDRILGLCSYLLFKKDYDTIHNLLDFNQPSDSSSYWVNENIFPDTIQDLIQFINRLTVLLNDLRFGFEDHHGSEKYLYELLDIILCRSISRVNNINNLEDIFQDIIRTDEIENMLSSFKAIEIRINQRKYDERTITCFLDKNPLIIYFISNTINYLTQKLHNTEVKSLIKIDFVKNFFSNVIKTYSANAIFNNLFKTEKVADLKPVETPVLGLKRLVSRIPFIEWHIPFYGLSESFGGYLFEQENLLIINQLSNLGNKLIQTNSECVKTLEDFPANKYIFFVINSYLSTYLADCDGFENSNVKNPYIGNVLESKFSGTINGNSIFSISVKDRKRRVLVIAKDSVSIKKYKLEVKEESIFMESENMYMDFRDFSDDIERTAYLKSLSLDEESSKNYENSLLKNVLIGFRHSINIEIDSSMHPTEINLLD
jgi:hypothetical protein